MSYGIRTSKKQMDNLEACLKTIDPKAYIWLRPTGGCDITYKGVTRFFKTNTEGFETVSEEFFNDLEAMGEI